ncbi:hypothetical protein OIE68_04235 [Nocardia vinacea]|uniref:hypothetical protein n=1 Tax=Nocardia vinacea TaxID=96468 RepID=UPI002E14A8A4|nr:hypothetical protein OIE68_04235 [Nocardia vinacea]
MHYEISAPPLHTPPGCDAFASSMVAAMIYQLTESNSCPQTWASGVAAAATVMLPVSPTKEKSCTQWSFTAQETPHGSAYPTRRFCREPMPSSASMPVRARLHLVDPIVVPKDDGS